MQTYLRYFNLILFFDFHIVWLLDIKSLHMKVLPCSFTYWQSLSKFCNHHIMVSITFSSSKRLDFECHPPSVKTWSLQLCVFPSGKFQVYLWMMWCGNIVLMTVWLFHMAEFTITPLSLLISCKFSFQIVGLKISSLHAFTLKTPKKVFL
jgi:hypothetical protein